MIYLPLQEGTKVPAVAGWADPDYPGVTPSPDGWFGLRCDGLVVMDFDTIEAARLWLEDHPASRAVRTPRGIHIYYRWTPGSPDGPRVGVLPNTDVRAGRGSFVVVPPTPGYSQVDVPVEDFVDFDPSWLPNKVSTERLTGPGWTQVPQGQRNATLATVAGSLRKQGADRQVLRQVLHGMNRSFCEPPLDPDEVDQIASSVSRYEPQPENSLTSIEVEQAVADVRWASKMKLPPPPEWWWKPYFPAGRLVFMDGREGIGKGMFATWLAALFAKGETPDGERIEPSNVLWLPTEDDPEDDILRRLYAAGVMGSEADVGFVDERLKFPRDEAVLIELIRVNQAKLVILDPGRSYLGLEEGQQTREFSYNNEAHVRPGMESLIRVAKATGATVLFVHHWKKDQSGDVFYRQAGSGAFNQVVRHRVTVARVEKDDGDIEGAFAVTKSNIASVGHVHAFTLETVESLDTARFVKMHPMPEFSSLDEWEKEAKKDREQVLFSRNEDLVYTLLAAIYRPGETLPGRRQLAEQVDMSERQLRDGMNALLDEGVITRHEERNAFIWNG